jgi:hypothetical protein
MGAVPVDFEVPLFLLSPSQIPPFDFDEGRLCREERDKDGAPRRFTGL